MGVVLMAFTVFDSFAEVYDDFDASDPEDLRDRAMLADAIMMYGLHGVEADLPKHLRRVFKAMKNAIDNSKDARGRGGKGRPPAQETRSDKPETQVSESENLGFPNGKPVSDKPETQVSESENPNLTYPSLSCSELDCAELSCDGGDAPAAPPEFEPPSLEEARGYFGANCLSGDPDAFWAYFESQGWIQGQRPAGEQLGRPRARLVQAPEAHRRRRPGEGQAHRLGGRGRHVQADEDARADEGGARAQVARGTSGHRPGEGEAPRGTTADPVALKAYQDARRLLDARAACERRAS